MIKMIIVIMKINCYNYKAEIFFLWRCGPTRAMASFMRFLDHTQLRITVGRTSLDE